MLLDFKRRPVYLILCWEEKPKGKHISLKRSKVKSNKIEVADFSWTRLCTKESSKLVIT